MNKGNKAIRHEGNKRYRGIAFKLLKIFAIPQYIYTSIRPFFRFSIPPYLNTSIPRRKRSLLLGFSLVELMIALITVSCITAAFAPVISKKMNSNNIAARLSDVTYKCDSVVNSECKVCTKSNNTCLMCAKSCEAGQIAKTSTCDCENCNLSNCAICKWTDDKQTAKTCTRCNPGYYLSNGNCIICQAGKYCDGANMKDCKEGTISSSGASTCSPCPEGQYQPNLGQSACNNCACTNCDRVSGSCNVQCGAGTVQDGVQCILDNSACGANTTKSGNQCIANTPTCATGTTANGFGCKLANSACGSNTSINSDGTKCNANTPTCGTNTTASGFGCKLANSACGSNTSINSDGTKCNANTPTCGTNTTASGFGCKANTPTCGAGTKASGFGCAIDASACGEGTYLKDGKCVRKCPPAETGVNANIAWVFMNIEDTNYNQYCIYLRGDTTTYNACKAKCENAGHNIVSQHIAHMAMQGYLVHYDAATFTLELVQTRPTWFQNSVGGYAVHSYNMDDFWTYIGENENVGNKLCACYFHIGRAHH